MDQVACLPPFTSSPTTRLMHSGSTASTASSGSFQVHTRALRPVAATLISYGRSSKISKSTTLYVIRVARADKSWYVARRYSEFRALHAALQSQIALEQTRKCSACHELATFYSAVRFPERFRLRSALFSTRGIETARMRDLNKYVQLLIETTQGLLADDDDDDDDVTDNEGVRCEAIAIVRDFLMVDDDDRVTRQQRCVSGSQRPTRTQSESQQLQQSESMPQRRRSRLTSRCSQVASFRVDELDVLYKERASDCVACFDALTSVDSTGSTAASLMGDPVFADVFEDFAAPPPDALVQHEYNSDDCEQQVLLRAGLHPLRRSESLVRSLH